MGLSPSQGIKIGQLTPGANNLISDVPGVTVGHCTLHDAAVQTGVTALIPHPGNCFEEKCPAGLTVLNGFGKSLGLMQVEELGQLETPIVLTNTLSVGTAWNALCKRMLSQNPGIGKEAGTVNPLVFECNDGHLNDIRAMRVQEEDVFAALDAAGEEFREGAVGAGRGMRCHGLKGGIGSSSRVFEIKGQAYTLGALVLTNHGALFDLTLSGKHIGPQAEALLKSGWASPYHPQEDKGSVIVILATDLPLSAKQLKRVSLRAVAGLSRTGSNIGHGSGEISLCFSTANRLRHRDPEPFHLVKALSEVYLDLAFRAAAEATEEAVLSSLYHAESVIGREGHRAEALRDVLRELDCRNQA